MGDLVQRVTTAIPSGAATVTIYAGTDYAAPNSNAIIRVVGTNSNGSGNATSANDTDITAYITNPANLATSITLTRVGTTGDLTIKLEILDFNELPTTHAIVVRQQEVIAVNGSTTGNSGTAVTGVVDNNKVIPLITSQETRVNDIYSWYDGIFTSDWDTVNQKAVVTRGNAASSGSHVSVAIIELTGGAWANVQRIEHAYSAADTVESVTLPNTLGSVSQAFIIDAQLRVGGYEFVSNYGQKAWLSSTTQISFWKYTLTGSSYGVAWIIEDTSGSLVAQHIVNSIAASTSSQNDTLTTLSDITRAAIFGETSGLPLYNGSDNQGMLSVEVTSTTAATVSRVDASYAHNYTYSVVEFPAVGGGGDVTQTPNPSYAIAASVLGAVILGSITLTPTPASAVAVSVDPVAIRGSLTQTPAPVSLVGVSISPAVVRGSLTQTPTPASVIAANVDPVTVRGSLTQTPTPASAIAASIDPTIIRGSFIYTPSQASAIALSIDPNVSIFSGGQTLTPTPASAVAASIDPTVIRGSYTYTPAPVSLVGLSISPAIVRGSYTYTPAPVSMRTESIDPTVNIGNAIAPSYEVLSVRITDRVALSAKLTDITGVKK